MIDITGKRFGRLVALSPHSKTKSRCIKWECKCDCGNIKIIDGKSLRSNSTKSCGCYSSDVHSKIMKERNHIHGMSKRNKSRKVYRTWASILTRCNNPNFHQYKDYGGRGISVCQRWHEFINFFNDMGHPPSKKHEIDRIDNDGDYEPNNCRWASHAINGRNSRWCKLTMKKAIEIRQKYKTGEYTYTDLAKQYDVSKSAINHIINNRTWVPDSGEGV